MTTTRRDFQCMAAVDTLALGILETAKMMGGSVDANVIQCTEIAIERLQIALIRMIEEGKGRA